MTAVQPCSFCERPATIYTLYRPKEEADSITVAFWCTPCIELHIFEPDNIPDQQGKHDALHPRSLDEQLADMRFDEEQAVNEAELILADARMEQTR